MLPVPRASDYAVLRSAFSALGFMRRARTRLEVAEHLGLHPRSALRLLQILMELGQVAVLLRGGGSGRPTIYRASSSRAPVKADVFRALTRHAQRPPRPPQKRRSRRKTARKPSR